MVVGLAQCVGTVASLILVERVGRRPLMVVGSSAMLCCNVAAACITGLAFDGTSISKAAGAALAVFLALFEVFLTLSILSLSWVIASEVGW